MKIEFYLDGSEVQLLREAMDSLPLNRYSPIILKVLTALPMGDTSTVATAPASCNSSKQRAGSGILTATRAHQAQMQAEINQHALEAGTFDQMLHDWLHAPLKGPLQ